MAAISKAAMSEPAMSEDAMTAAIQSCCKTPYHRLDPQIFDEKAKADENTVNGCLAPGSVGDAESSGKTTNYVSRTIRLMAKARHRGARLMAELSTLRK